MWCDSGWQKKECLVWQKKSLTGYFLKERDGGAHSARDNSQTGFRKYWENNTQILLIYCCLVITNYSGHSSQIACLSCNECMQWYLFPYFSYRYKSNYKGKHLRYSSQILIYLEAEKNVLTELKKKSQYDIMSGTFNGISEDKSTNKYKKWLQ